MRYFKADSYLFYTLFSCSNFNELAQQLPSMSPSTVNYMIESFSFIEPFDDASHSHSTNSIIEIGDYRIYIAYDDSLIIETLLQNKNNYDINSLF